MSEYQSSPSKFRLRVEGKPEIEHRRKMIRRARKSAEVVYRDGRKFKLIRLPDGYGGVD